MHMNMNMKARPVARADVRMLRNVDRCECLVITLGALIATGGGQPDPRSGVHRLVSEALAQDTMVAALNPPHGSSPDEIDRLFAELPPMRHFSLDALAPTTPELTLMRRSFTVTPDGFGGTDGFGRAPTQTDREPLAARCVVLVTTLPECIAALGAGMRAVALPVDEVRVDAAPTTLLARSTRGAHTRSARTRARWRWRGPRRARCATPPSRSQGWAVDPSLEGVADACLDSLGSESDPLAVTMDDLSTPGAFWLNPPLPRDAEGNRVDPETGDPYAAPGPAATGDDTRGADAAAASEDEEEARALEILRNLDRD